jgi:hypothetical protein
MSIWSPTAEGFRAIFRRPAISLAEIAWRWSFGAAATLLGALGLFEYLDTLPVSNRDIFLLRTGAPALVGHALSDILRGSASRFLLATLVVGAGVAILWIIVASLGRAVTLAALLESIRGRALLLAHTGASNSDGVQSANLANRAVSSLAGLHFLRFLVFVLVGFATAGAIFATRLLSPAHEPHPGAAFLAFLFFAFAIFLAAASLNWLLSLATLFVVRDGNDSFGAISAAMDLCRDRLGAVFAVGTWFGLAHISFFVIASSVVGFPLSLLGILPPGFALLGVLLVTLLYLAIADSLYIGRLAGYAAILEGPSLPSPTLAAHPTLAPQATCSSQTMFVPHAFAGPNSSSSGPNSETDNVVSAAVDQSEVILSDAADEASRQPSQDSTNAVDQADP